MSQDPARDVWDEVAQLEELSRAGALPEDAYRSQLQSLWSQLTSEPGTGRVLQELLAGGRRLAQGLDDYAVFHERVTQIWTQWLLPEEEEG